MPSPRPPVIILQLLIEEGLQRLIGPRAVLPGDYEREDIHRGDDLYYVDVLPGELAHCQIGDAGSLEEVAMEDDGEGDEIGIRMDHLEALRHLIGRLPAVLADSQRYLMGADGEVDEVPLPRMDLLIELLQLGYEGIGAAEVDIIDIFSDDKNTIKFLRNIGCIKNGVGNFAVFAGEDSPLKQYSGYNKQENWRIRPATSDNGLS